MFWIIKKNSYLCIVKKLNMETMLTFAIGFLGIIFLLVTVYWFCVGVGLIVYKLNLSMFEPFSTRDFWTLAINGFITSVVIAIFISASLFLGIVLINLF